MLSRLVLFPGVSGVLSLALMQLLPLSIIAIVTSSFAYLKKGYLSPVNSGSSMAFSIFFFLPFFGIGVEAFSLILHADIAATIASAIFLSSAVSLCRSMLTTISCFLTIFLGIFLL